MTQIQDKRGIKRVFVSVMPVTLGRMVERYIHMVDCIPWA
jgi:hypothetical protein